ncbi:MULTISPECIES: MerR family DNA-binding transcriptional regulator, partial [Acinetobacter]
MSRYVSIGVAAKTLGVSIQTLRRWDEEGTLVADRTP